MTAPRHLRLALSTLVALPVFLSAASAQDKASDPSLDAKRSELDQRYAIGPTPARELGYRIVWQSTLGGPVSRLTKLGDSLFTVSDDEWVGRIDAKTGTIIWNFETVEANHTVWGITEDERFKQAAWGQNNDDNVCVTCDTSVTFLDLGTGSIVRREKLDKSPSSSVIRSGRNLIYGSHVGQVVWFNYAVGSEWRATQLWGPINTSPIIAGDFVAAVSSKGNETRKSAARNQTQPNSAGSHDDPKGQRDRQRRFWKNVNPERGEYEAHQRRTSIGMRGGSIGVLNATTSRVQWGWGDKLFEGIVAEPTFGGGLLFCAGVDQYLWAFDASRGNVVWKYLATAPLTTSPIYVSAQTPDDQQLDLVLQWVEGQGLMAFEADAGNTIEGKVVWTIPDARGDSIGMIQGQVALWDANAKVLRLIDAGQGSIVKTIPLPQVDSITMEGDSIFATGTDGRVIRLDPVG